MNRNSIGIVSLATYIPDNFMTSQELANKSGVPQDVIEDKMGIKQKPIPGKEDHTCEMGIKAANRAIEKGEIDPENIDLVIYIGEEHKEWLLWTAGIKLQYEIGAENAWAFDISQRCGTGVVGIEIAKSLMMANPDINTVLLAGGYRNCDFIDYENPRVRFMYNLGSGGGAMILQKGLNKNKVLESSIITDGSLSEDVIVPAGGTKQPISSEAIKNKENYLDVTDPEGMKERLDEVSIKNFFKVIETAVEKSGYSTSDIDYLALLHMKKSAHKGVLEELNLSEKQSIYLEEYGHLGQFDQILSTELALEQGKITDGDLVVWVSAGIGYAWNASVIKWGN
ncbi:3-oxoacyl-ACP synthase [Natranaerobius thermophilus]